MSDEQFEQSAMEHAVRIRETARLIHTPLKLARTDTWGSAYFGQAGDIAVRESSVLANPADHP